MSQNGRFRPPRVASHRGTAETGPPVTNKNPSHLPAPYGTVLPGTAPCSAAPSLAAVWAAVRKCGRGAAPPGCRREPDPAESTSSVRRRNLHDSKAGSGGAGWPNHRPGALRGWHLGGGRTIAVFKDNFCHELVEPQSVTKIILKNDNRPEDDFPAPRPGQPSRAPAAGRATRARRLSRAGRRSGNPSVGWGAEGTGGLIDRAECRPIGTTTPRVGESAYRIAPLSTRRSLDSVRMGGPPELGGASRIF